MQINENLIHLDLEADSKEAVISRLAALGYGEGRIISIEAYMADVLKREETYAIGVGNGIAIPHAKSDSVKEAMIVFGRTKGGIEWDSLDDQPVDTIFLLGVPEEGTERCHL